jgi:TRAP-type C4-dicarboxylate transport system permease small subunit
LDSSLAKGAERISVLDRLVLSGNKIWRVLAFIASAFMFVNMAFIILNIVLRRFFSMPIFGATELVCYISLTVASFALCQNEWVDGNIRMTLILESLKERGGYILLFIVNLVCSVFFVIFSYLFIVQAIGKFQVNDTSYDLHIPVWIPNAILALGVCAMTACIIIKMLMYFCAIRTGKVFDLRKIAILDAGEDALE